MPVTWPGPPGAVNADGRVVDVAGLRIAGLGGSIRYRPGPDQWTEREQARRGRRLSRRVALRRLRDGGGVDVLLTHAPPRGCGDRGDPPHRGVRSLHSTVRRLRPGLLIHGHIHPFGEPVGDRELHGTRVVNAVGYRMLDVPGRPVVRSSPMRRDTGFPRADAEYDFLRVRRRQVLARLAMWLRREPDDVNVMLPFDEVLSALGQRGQRRIGLRVLRLDSIVGSVDRTRDFDRRFRPTSARVRERWERLALARRRGESVPPIDVYRIGDLHFVKDGHHRVSVALAQGLETIDAYVTEVVTMLHAGDIRFRGDLMVKNDRRLFLERVPLRGEARAAISLPDAWRYTELSETVEAWGFRVMQDEGRFLDRQAVALRWYEEEFIPVIAMLRQADLIGDRTEAEAYLAVGEERYRLMRTHRWDDEVIAAVRSSVARR
ncbi:hypothetical protein UA75_04755 [Actinoalloteichus sp. GBA129-24]|nr:hypothetical protein UA75_04755 [Actinoalloteichus sp. GBA129-24]